MRNNAHNCPVAPLSDEAARLSTTIRELGTALMAAQKNLNGDELYETEEQIGASDFQAHEHIDNLIDRASYLQAESGAGVLFQLSALCSVIDMIQGHVTPSKETTFAVDELERQAHRLLYSIAGYIETTTGAKIESTGANFLMPSHRNPHSQVERTLKLVASNKNKAA